MRKYKITGKLSDAPFIRRSASVKDGPSIHKSVKKLGKIRF